MAAARERDRCRTARRVVPNSIMCRRMIVAKYTGCGNKPNGTSRFCFNDCAACTSPGPPVIEPRCVAHATGNTLTHVPTPRPAGSRRAARYGRGRGPGHAAAPRRRPHVVRRAEVLVERGDVEIGERARPGEPSTTSGVEPGVGDRAFDGFGADLTRRSTRRLGVRRLADADDRDLVVDDRRSSEAWPQSVTDRERTR